MSTGVYDSDIDDNTRATARNTERIAEAMEELVKEMRNMGEQMTRRMDTLEQAIADPKSDAAQALAKKYKRTVSKPGA